MCEVTEQVGRTKELGSAVQQWAWHFDDLKLKFHSETEISY